MTVSEQPAQSAGSFLLAGNLPSLLLMTVALFFTALLGISGILQGKIRFWFSYWQCFPCLPFLLGACLMSKQSTLCDHTQRIRLAMLALLALSPFPTWAVRSSGNTYFEICSVACLASALWLLLETCQWLKSIAEADKSPILALAARKTQFSLLCFSVIPLSAVYASGLLGLHTGVSRSFQDVLQVWSYGRISVILRVFLYWGVLQFMTLCLYATFIAGQQIKKTFAKEDLEQN
jgi:hypothetical protein